MKWLNKAIAWFKGPKNKVIALDDKRSKPTMSIGDKVGNVTLLKPYQLDKHTAFKVGESYRVGEMIVTLRASKEDVARIIAQVDAKRALKEEKLKERAIELMLMTPEELSQLHLNEWLTARGVKAKTVEAIVGGISNQRLMLPEELPPHGSLPVRIKAKFTEIMKSIKEKVS